MVIVNEAFVRRFFPHEKALLGVMLAGLEVPHCHFHVVPIRGLHDLDFGNQDPDPPAEMMDEAAQTIRRELRRLSYSQVSD